MISGNLFTLDYLLEGIAQTDYWKSLDDDRVENIKKGLLKHAQKLLAVSKPNEAQTEKTLIYPALELVGWTEVEVQQNLSTKGRKQVPDALLFGDQKARNRAVALKETWKGYQHGLSILEAKRWGRALDRPDKRDAQEEGVPSTQMLEYVSRVDVQTSGKLRLGILTNGQKWRLYFQGALSVSEDFLEIDLAKALELPGHELDLVDRADRRMTPNHCLRLFILMFGKPAFLPMDGARTFHDISRDAGKMWEQRVTKDLSHLVFHDLFPMLVAGLAKHDKECPKNISQPYLEDVRQSALVLLYRLLFVVYAEDRDLLPDNQEPYKSYSLTTMRLDIADRTAKGQMFSPTMTTYWPKLAAVFRAIADGDDTLGIPPYNGGLFAKESAPLLSRVQLPDAIVANLVFKLSHRADEENATPRYINYRDLTVQQLGTIYERTLEYGLRVERGTVVVDADDTARHESGSYYTPDSLVTAAGNVGIGTSAPTGAPAYLYSSDARLKSDIQPIDGPLDKIGLLKGVSFRFTKDGDKGRRRIGVIAQDVEKVFPEAVVTDPSGTKSVDYPSLIAPLIESTKALNTKVKTLEAANDNLRLELKAANDNYINLKRDVDALNRARTQ